MLERLAWNFFVRRYSKRRYIKETLLPAIWSAIDCYRPKWREYEVNIRGNEALKLSSSNGKMAKVLFFEGFNSEGCVHAVGLEGAYTSRDFVGKMGIEALLKNSYVTQGKKKNIYLRLKGNCHRELSGARDPIQGKRALLTISPGLQEYAEILLAQNEDIAANRKLGTWQEVFPVKAA